MTQPIKHIEPIQIRTVQPSLIHVITQERRKLAIRAHVLHHTEKNTAIGLQRPTHYSVRDSRAPKRHRVDEAVERIAAKDSIDCAGVQAQWWEGLGCGEDGRVRGGVIGGRVAHRVCFGGGAGCDADESAEELAAGGNVSACGSAGLHYWYCAVVLCRWAESRTPDGCRVGRQARDCADRLFHARAVQLEGVEDWAIQVGTQEGEDALGVAVLGVWRGSFGEVSWFVWWGEGVEELGEEEVGVVLYEGPVDEEEVWERRGV